MEYCVIAISGEVASGKSSIALELQNKMSGWTRLNTGQKFRDFCESKGKTIQYVSHLSDETHIEFDNYQTDLMREGKNLIVEGRLAGWLARDIPHVFRVFCYAPIEIRIERYVKRHNVSMIDARNDIEYRDSKDVKKFLKVYNILDYRAPEYYSLMLDTSNLRPFELADVIIAEANIANN